MERKGGDGERGDGVREVVERGWWWREGEVMESKGGDGERGR